VKKATGRSGFFHSFNRKGAAPAARPRRDGYGGQAEGGPYGRCGGAGLEAAQAEADGFDGLMELEAAVGFVAVPEAGGFPDAIFVRAFFGGEDLHANAGKAAGQVEEDGGVHAGDEEFVWAELGDDGSAARVFVAGRAAAVILRVAVGDAGLPGAEIEFLLGFAGFLDGSFELAFEI
jgi:hypothetical protein